MRSGWLITLIFILVTALPTPAHAESGTATLTIHYRQCPRGYDCSLYHQICYTHPVRNAELGVTTSDYRDRQTGMTDDSGDVIYELPPGAWVVDGLPGEFLTDRHQV